MYQKELKFSCKSLNNSGRFPLDNTGRGKNLSPEFIIKNLSTQAKSLIVTLEDLSHPIKDFTHWVIWDIPATTKIPAAIPSGKIVETLGGARQGIAYGVHRYAGPKPPKGRSHQYRFSIYALDKYLELGPLSTKKKVLSAAVDHILQQGSICGYFE